MSLDYYRRIASFGLISALLNTVAALGPCAKTAAQTRYEWIPGSRQARAVTAGTPTQAEAQRALQMQQARYTGGMRSRQAVIQSFQMQQAGSAPAAPLPRQDGGVSTCQTGRTTRPNAMATAVSKQKALHFVESISVDGLQRQFQVHVPPGYDRNRATPVVLIFHGLQMNGTMMVGTTGFNMISDRNNFVAVYGEAANGRWNDGHSGSGADDVAYVSALLDKLSRVVNVDRKRIYACGISNGGYFSQFLACAMPEKIAAVGVVASPMMKQTQSVMQSAKPVPIVFFLGTDDPLLPWDDGRTKDIGKLGEVLGLSGIGSIDNGLAQSYGGLLTVPETISFWTSHNGCSDNARLTQEPDQDPRDGTRVKKEVYGLAGNEVVLYTIDGGGHTWPGCPNLKMISSISGNISQDIDASALMWQFFKSHNR